MNILIAADIFPPQSGGPATYSALLHRVLSLQGHGVTVVTHTLPSKEEDRGTEEKQGIFRVHRHFFLWRYFEYFVLLKRHGRMADVLYAMGPVNAGLPAWLVARLLKKPFVCKVVGDYAWEQGVARFGVGELPDEFQKKKYGWRVELLRWIEKFVCRRVARVIVPAHYLKKMVEGWGVDSSRVVVIYNAVEGAGGGVVSTSKGGQQGISGVSGGPNFANKKIIFSASRLMPWKGMVALIEIMPDILKKEPAAHLVIAGEGPEKQNLEFRIKNLELGDAVTLLGKIGPVEMQQFFKRAVVFVLNSAYEGMPHVVLEAFSAGCPVVAAACGGTPEIVQHEKTGLLVPYNDHRAVTQAILQILHNEALRRQCQEGGRVFASTRTAARMADETLRLLHNTFDRR